MSRTATAPQPGAAVKVADDAGRPSAPRTTARHPRSLCACFRGRSKRPAAISICAVSGPPKSTAARGPGFRRLPRGARRGRPAARADRGPLRRLPGRPDPRSGHGRRQAEHRLLPRGDLPARGNSGAQRCGRCARRSNCRSRRGACRRSPGFRVGSHERPAPSGGPAARAEDRHLPRPAGELPAPRRAAAAAARRSIAFTSTGGFALHLAALRAGATRWTAPPPALDPARANAEANGIGNVDFREADVFDLLGGLLSARRQFCYGRARPAGLCQIAAIDRTRAARGYKEINLRALRLLGPGGILVTCSCSHHINEAMLLELVAQASLDANALCASWSGGPSRRIIRFC